MPLEEAGGRRGRLGAPGKTRPLGGDIEPGENLLEAPVDKCPGAHILRFLLAPDDLRVAVAPEHLGERVEREWVELLDADQRDTLVTAGGPRLCQIEIDLAGAQHDAAHLVIRGDRLR